MQPTVLDEPNIGRHIIFIENQYAFIAIDSAIILKLKLTDEDSFIEEITSDGILLRRKAK